MPRIPRSSVGGVCYHITNRSDADEPAFRGEADYDHFVALIAAATERLPMGVLAYCLLPDVFHLVLRPKRAGDISRWMQWLMTSHAHRHRHAYGTDGRIWEGRYKAFPVQQGDSLITMLRYVEASPVDAEFADKAQDWQWNSLYLRTQRKAAALTEAERTLQAAVTDLPMALPANWPRLVNAAMEDATYQTIATCIARNRPFGDDNWTRAISKRLGLESTLRPRGRPRKTAGRR